MNKSIGFIGGGNMGSAIIGGVLNAGLLTPKNIFAADISDESIEKLKSEFKINASKNNLDAAAADILFLAVKPKLYPTIINEIASKTKKDVVIVSIAAGQTIASIEAMFNVPTKIVRVMPNTPALVGEGMAAICPNAHVCDEELAEIVKIFESVGKAEVVDEGLIDAVIGASGSAPAYVYMFIEAMADAVVAQGMPREQAYRFCAQAVLGAAKMVLETGQHPGVLKDNVCSAGGTTIAAVCEMEKQGLRGAVISGVNKCIEKSNALSNQK